LLAGVSSSQPQSCQSISLPAIDPNQGVVTVVIGSGAASVTLATNATNTTAASLQEYASSASWTDSAAAQSNAGLPTAAQLTLPSALSAAQRTWSYAGCFLDSANRILPLQLTPSSTFSADVVLNCMALARSQGYTVISIQNVDPNNLAAVQCFVCPNGTTCNWRAAPVSESGCAIVASSAVPSALYAGTNNWGTAIYELLPVVQPTLESRAGKWTYRKCVIDNANARVVPTMMQRILPSNGDVVFACQQWARAKGFDTIAIIATAAWHECWACAGCQGYKTATAGPWNCAVTSSVSGVTSASNGKVRQSIIFPCFIFLDPFLCW
jgi:hypothetical protein